MEAPLEDNRRAGQQSEGDCYQLGRRCRPAGRGMRSGPIFQDAEALDPKPPESQGARQPEIQDAGEPERLPREKLTAAVVIAAASVANLLVAAGSPLPWIGAVAGFLLAVCLPAWVLSQKINWRTESPAERLCYSIVTAIFGLMLVGLAINTVLPHIGISRPLDRGPVLIAVDCWCGALALWRRARFHPIIPRPHIDVLGGADRTVGVLSALCVPLAIMGANRLNNGAGSGLTLVMLILAAIVLLLMFAKRDELNSGTITAAIYFLALSMLLMTSLRGWYITGHDIQQEYKVFQLTKEHGDWNVALFRDPYNACLSITILPTMLWQLLRVDDPYIYKFWFQLLFALCPVFVYRISLRYTNRAIAIIATIYFVAFPTYFNDMTFLNRQEIAFLFVAACVMTATQPSLPPMTTRLRVGILSVGVILSHYSTAYVFLGTLAIGWSMHRVFIVLRAMRRKSTTTEPTPKRRLAGPAISLANVALLLLGIGLWNGAATHTANGLSSAISQVIASLRGAAGDSKSADVSYSLFGGATESSSQLLSQYTQSTIAGTGAHRVADGFLPQQVISKYPLAALPLVNLPTTGAGKIVDDAGVNVTTLNSLTRAGAAKLLQLFVILGLLSAFFARKRNSRSLTELIALASGALVIVVLQVVLPAISVDYGVLRAFQQALIVFGPLVAVGSLVIFRFLNGTWSLRAAFVVAILFFASLVGLVPQILGGYPAQLNLNNSGQYYDIYYTHEQDITALNWLQDRISAGSGGSAAGARPLVDMDAFTYNELQTFTHLNISNNDFPTLLQKKAYVFLGYQTVSHGTDTLIQNGNLIIYNYPVALLNTQYNLVYSSNGAAIYGQVLQLLFHFECLGASFP